MTTLFLAPAIEQVQRKIGRAGCEYEPLEIAASEAGGCRDWAATLAAARAHGCDVVVVDSHQAGDAYLAALREKGCIVVAIDDLARHSFSAHLVVNGGAGAERQAYRSVTGDTTFLLGPRYALLGRAFWSVPARVVAPRVHRVLVTVGGGDPHGIVPRILDVLDQIRAPLTVTAVRGPFAGSLDTTEAHRRHRVDFVDSPDDLCALMIDADLAVSGAGQTLYQLAATGTPTIAIQMFDNQESNRRHLTAAGVVRDGGCVTDGDFDARLSSVLNEVLERHGERVQMSIAGPSLVDGRGATRVANAIAALAAT